MLVDVAAVAGAHRMLVPLHERARLQRDGFLLVPDGERLVSNQLPLPVIEPATKKCSRCGLVKPWSGFYLRTRYGKKKPNSFCRKCAVKRVLKWKRDEPEAYAAHKRQRIWVRRVVKEKILGAPVRCEICGKAFTQSGQRGPAFDHDHGSGRARAWLCGPCNGGLGSFGDNPAILRAAAEYLLRHGHTTARPRIA